MDNVKVSRRLAIAGSAAAAAVALVPFGPNLAAEVPEPETLAVGRGQIFDFGWLFRKGGGAFEAVNFDDSGWRRLDLPHDWGIEDLPPGGEGRIGPFDRAAEGGGAVAFAVGGEGWYRKHFSTRGLPAGVHVELLFGGAYTESDVWLNGLHIGSHLHGYTPFGIDLTPQLRDGDNVVAVRVRNLGRNSRWYSGSGLYRSVTVDVVSQPARVERWGVSVVTRSIAQGDAELAIETRLAEPADGLTVLSRIRDPEGNAVAEVSSPAAAVTAQRLDLRSARLWAPQSPTLYTLETELRRVGKVIDRVLTPFGVRIVTFDSGAGMRINGQSVKLRGGCVHHDNGLLGAVALADAEDRRVRLLKARGFNAIRSAHNPASQAFAEACDRHGMFLVEEAFDMWRWPKNAQDYSVHFSDSWQQDLTAMVLSARNHPSVIMWSIGNEVPGRLSHQGLETAWDLANLVHRLDPTRPVTAAINGLAGRPVTVDAETARKDMAGLPDEPSHISLDVSGYNYKLDRYAPDHELFSKRIIYGSESYPIELFDIWSFIDAHPYVVGDFVWSAMDYLGEAGIGRVAQAQSKVAAAMADTWPWVVSGCGDLDLTGRQRAQSLARDVAWGLSPLELAVAPPLPEGVQEYPSAWGWPKEWQSWTWPDLVGKPMEVRIYASADEVELRLNGLSAASKKLAPGQTQPITFKVAYAPGNLEAIAYRNGHEIARRRLETVGQAVGVRITPEQTVAPEARHGLAYLHLEIIDEAGRVVPSAAIPLRLTIQGSASLLALGSANPLATGSFQQSSATTFEGRALAILKSSGAPGPILIRAEAPGLRMASAMLAASADRKPR